MNAALGHVQLILSFVSHWAVRIRSGGRKKLLSSYTFEHGTVWSYKNEHDTLWKRCFLVDLIKITHTPHQSVLFASLQSSLNLSVDATLCPMRKTIFEKKTQSDGAWTCWHQCLSPLLSASALALSFASTSTSVTSQSSCIWTVVTNAWGPRLS